ncbi:MAG: copper chaperone PCu(A)C [Pseudooceanicola sp.]|nr:copper chaperone PCu(A)C [Pseudooceanicola sp.]
MKVAKPLAILALAIAIVAAAWLLRPEAMGPAPLLSDAVALPVMGEPGTVTVALAIENRGGADRIVGASSDAGAAVIVGGTSAEGLPVPAGSTPSLSLDGAHVVLSDLRGDLDEGRLIPLTLTFEKAGPVTTRARVGTPGPTDHAAHGMAAVLDLGPKEVAPKVVMDLRPDGEGWAITLDTGAFRLTEDGVDGQNVSGQGHAHLYLGGLKLQRMYGPTAHVGALPKGQHILQVVLNTNDHRALQAGGEPVGAIALIDAR